MPFQKFWSVYPFCVCVQKTKEEDKTFWCVKYFVYLHERTWSVCCAFLFFLSAHETRLPTFMACGLVSGKVQVCVSPVCLLALTALSSALRVCHFAPCSSPGNSEQDGPVGRWRNYGEGIGLGPEHGPDCLDFPALPRPALASAVGLDQVEGWRMF